MTTTIDLVNTPAPGALANRDAAVPLQHIDTLVTRTDANIGNANVTSVAQQLLDYDTEAMVWQDKPHLSLMLSSVLKWVMIAVIWTVALAVFAPKPVLPASEQAQVEAAPAEKPAKKKSGRNAKQAKAAEESQAAASEASAAKQTAKDELSWHTILTWLGFLVFAYQVYAHLMWALRLKCIKYKMTSQRLTIESGIFSKINNTYELHKLNAGQIHSPFFLRMFGCANLYAGVWLSGIRNAEAVRDLIRNAGQIEASRVDKARFR